MSRVYDYAVWSTRGGALVRERNGVLIFVEAPSHRHDLKVGDTMPEVWDISPANELARTTRPPLIGFGDQLWT